MSISLTNLELKDLGKSMSIGFQNFDQIMLCQSSSCIKVDRSQFSSNYVKSPDNCYMDKYQVAIVLQETKRIKIFEISLFWNQQ